MTNIEDRNTMASVIEALNNLLNPSGGITRGFALLIFDPETKKTINCSANSVSKDVVEAMNRYIGAKSNDA